MYAHNDMTSAISLAVLRAQYQSAVQKVLPNGRLDPVYKDINSYELQYYGKININGFPVYLDDSYLVGMNSSAEYFGDKTQRVLPFIRDMHSRMKTNIQVKITAGILPISSEAIAKMEPVTTYVSPFYQYRAYIRDLLISFNNSLSETDNDNITHFNHYVNKFYEYISQLQFRTPFTFSGWTTSKENSIFTSGLTISLMDNEYHRDDQNSSFIANLMFPYYKKLALNTGFCLVKQAPWIMIADLNSPAIQPYYQEGIGTASRVFNYYYKLCHTVDIELLYNNLIKYYNDLVTFKEETRKINVMCTNKTKVTKQKRKHISDFDMTFRDPKKYLTMYIKMRNMEEGQPLSKLVLNQVIKKSKRYLDINLATGYINSIFAAELFKKPFGLNDSIRRFNSRVQAKKGIGPTEKDTQQAVGTGTSSFTGGSSGGGGGMSSGGGSGGGY